MNHAPASTTTTPLWPTDQRQVWVARAADHRLPYWLRVVAYAEAWCAPSGHCPLTPEELHQALDRTMDKALVSRAIRRACAFGWLHPASSARCLILASSSTDADCPATHRATS